MNTMATALVNPTVVHSTKKERVMKAKKSEPTFTQAQVQEMVTLAVAQALAAVAPQAQVAIPVVNGPKPPTKPEDTLVAKLGRTIHKAGTTVTDKMLVPGEIILRDKAVPYTTEKAGNGCIRTAGAFAKLGVALVAFAEAHKRA